VSDLLPWIKAHPGHQRVGSVRVVLPSVDGPDHLRRQHRGEPPRRAVRVGAVAHAFDVPARRDPGLLAGRVGQPHGGAAAQADRSRLRRLCRRVVGVRAGPGLVAMWSSAQRGGRLRPGGVLATLGSVVVTGTVVLAVLPAPHVAGASTSLRPRGPAPPCPCREDWPVTQGGPVGQTGHRRRRDPCRWVPGVLQPSRHRPTRRLGDTVVMRVRADRPSYWIGETFDSWDGANWSATPTPHSSERLDESSPFILPGSRRARGRRATFRRSMSCSPRRTRLPCRHGPRSVFPTHDLFISDQDSIVSRSAWPRGHLHGGVVREQALGRPAARRDGARRHPGVIRADTKVPHPYPRGERLSPSL